jgi:tetratricopeptide (TPR) repeat protein
MTRASTPRRARAERDRYVAIAQSFLKARKYSEAIAPLREASRITPSDAGILNDLGVAYLFSGQAPEAIGWLRRSIALRPSAGFVHANLGLALQHTGQDEQAIHEYRQAVELSPDLGIAHAWLADLLLEKGARAEAAAAYARASACAPGTVFGRLCQANALDAEDRPEDAAEELRQLVASDGANNGRAHVLLGKILHDKGRFDEAAACYERSIAADPWYAGAYHGLIASRRLTQADRPWISRMQSLLEAKEWHKVHGAVVAERQLMMLHFALGKALDDLGEYADAMSHFHAANKSRRKQSAFDPHEVEQRINQLVARFTPEFFAAHSAIGHDDPTPILIVGMPRSGTTLLERIVSSHPKVHGCGELDFWVERGPAWANAAADKLAKAANQLRGDYLRILRKSAPEALRATDKMPFNFFWVGLVHLLLPNARIVHVRRNPIDTCFSIYATLVGKTWGFASSLGDLASYYKLYLRLMDHWRAVIPSGRLLDVNYEDVVSEPETLAKQLIAFCGLEWDAACSRPEANCDPVKTASKWQARQPVYGSSVERWRRYEPWIGELRELLDLS